MNSLIYVCTHTKHSNKICANVVTRRCKKGNGTMYFVVDPTEWDNIMIYCDKKNDKQKIIVGYQTRLINLLILTPLKINASPFNSVETLALSSSLILFMLLPIVSTAVPHLKFLRSWY